MGYMRFPREAQPLQNVHTLILDMLLNLKECVTLVIRLLSYLVRGWCVKIWFNRAVIPAWWHQPPWQTDTIRSPNYCLVNNDFYWNCFRYHSFVEGRCVRICINQWDMVDYAKLPDLGRASIDMVSILWRWYGFDDSGDVEMIWFCHSADVEMVWFCHSGRVEMVWFWWLGRCKNGLVLILGRCWYSLVAALGRRNRWSSFGVPREMLVQFGFCTRETWNPPQTPYISRVRATSPESNHTPPEGENASGDVKNRFWL